MFSLEKSWFKDLIFTSNLSLAVFWYLMYFICVPQPWYYWDTPGPPWATSHHVSVGRLWWSLSWCFIKIQALDTANCLGRPGLASFFCQDLLTTLRVKICLLDDCWIEIISHTSTLLANPVLLCKKVPSRNILQLSRLWNFFDYGHWIIIQTLHFPILYKV